MVGNYRACCAGLLSVCSWRRTVSIPLLLKDLSQASNFTLAFFNSTLSKNRSVDYVILKGPEIQLRLIGRGLRQNPHYLTTVFCIVLHIHKHSRTGPDNTYLICFFCRSTFGLIHPFMISILCFRVLNLIHFII